MTIPPIRNASGSAGGIAQSSSSPTMPASKSEASSASNTSETTDSSTKVDLSDAARTFDILERLKRGERMSDDDMVRVIDKLSPGTSFMMSNGSVAVVGDPSKEEAIPMSVAWAPQLLVKGDSDGDRKLSFKEFAGIMRMAGMSQNDAAGLFAKFNHGKDGAVSVEDFVEGVSAAEASGNDVFTRVIQSFLNDAEGKMDDEAYKKFMAQGSEVADRYWGQHRHKR